MTVDLELALDRPDPLSQAEGSTSADANSPGSHTHPSAGPLDLPHHRATHPHTPEGSGGDRQHSSSTTRQQHTATPPDPDGVMESHGHPKALPGALPGIGVPCREGAASLRSASGSTSATTSSAETGAPPPEGADAAALLAALSGTPSAASIDLLLVLFASGVEAARSFADRAAAIQGTATDLSATLGSGGTGLLLQQPQQQQQQQPPLQYGVPDGLSGDAASTWTSLSCIPDTGMGTPSPRGGSPFGGSRVGSRYTPPPSPLFSSYSDDACDAAGGGAVGNASGGDGGGGAAGGGAGGALPRVTRASLERFYLAHDVSGRLLQRHIECELLRRCLGEAGRRCPAEREELQRRKTRRSPAFAHPATRCWVVEFLKRHSIVNDIFFRPPKPNYTHRQAGLVLLRLRHHAPLPALWLPQEKLSRGVLVFAHSNACDISQNPIIETYRAVYNMSVLSPEWPGYGLATGSPSEAGLSSVLLETVLHLHYVMQVPLCRIILFGRSLATGPCVEVAAALERQGYRLGGVVLKSGYLSWRRAIAEAGEPDSALRSAASCLSRCIFDRYPTYQTIRRVKCPLLFIHGRLDKVVPYTHSEELHALAGTPDTDKMLCLVDTGCHDYGIEVWDGSREFISGLSMSTPGTALPFLRTWPDSAYDDIEEWCGLALAERQRHRLMRTLRWAAVGLVGVGDMAFGAYLVIDNGGDACSPRFQAGCILHGVTLVAGAVLYHTADWMQEDLQRAQDPEVQQRCLVFLLCTLLLFVVDLVYVHVAVILEHPEEGGLCRSAYWWTGFAFVAATIYPYLLQAVITNK